MPRIAIVRDSSRAAGARAFTLVWGDIPIARVCEEDCDLVSIMGSYRLAEDARQDPTLRAVIAWHDVCVRQAAQLNRGRADDGSGGVLPPRPPDLNARHSWALVDAQGHRHPIAAPRFLSGGKLTWGWA